MPKVSVIVPVYKVEAYLEKCLQSLVNQTLEEIEIIVVNDGSPDGSGKIIDHFVEAYPKKVKKIDQENKGLSEARNAGIKEATAPYLGFVDSDDWVDLQMYEKLYQKAISKNFDLVVCNLQYTYPNKLLGNVIMSGVKEDIIGKEKVKKQFSDLYPTAWNKLYRRSLFDGTLFFKPGVWFEDVEFLYRLLPRVSSIGMIEDICYYYLQREGQITKTVDPRIYHYIDNWNGLWDYYNRYNLMGEYQKELEYNYVRYLYGTFLRSCLKFSKEEYLKALKMAIKNVKEHIPNRKNNDYFYQHGLFGYYLLWMNSFFGKMMYHFKFLFK